MASETPRSANSAPATTGEEHYVHGYGREMRDYHGSRTATHDAAYFVPHLRPGMSLIDLGCGPGSITCGLAEIVAPGQVVGVDIAEAQLSYAREVARQRGIGNVRFQQGDICALPFPDASFDAAFAHNVLEHPKDPPRAMREMRRVVRHGGVVGVVDPDFGTYLSEPSTPLRQSAFELFIKVMEHNGASPFYARHQRQMLRESGFVRVESYALTESHGTLDETRRFTRALAQNLREPAFVAVALEHGWADQAMLGRMADDLEARGDDPDAYIAILCPSSVAWVPDQA